MPVENSMRSAYKLLGLRLPPPFLRYSFAVPFITRLCYYNFGAG
jgi:hypothetical protein